MKKPLLRRDIQLISTAIEGQKVILFMDPLRLVQNSFAVDISLLPLFEALNGQNDLRDIQMEMMRQQGGRLVSLSEIEAFMEQLDNIFLLESDLFYEKVESVYGEFSRLENRPPSHAGSAYEADPVKLSRFIDAIEQNLPRNDSDYIHRHITGVVAPHIDIMVGSTTYIDLYRHVKGKNYKLVVILGIDHQRNDGLYSVSEKNFITPFGTIKTDRDFISQLKKRVPQGTLSSNDFGHRTEHSIEFQTIFLHYYLEEPFCIVPILCGGIHEFIYQGKNIFADERFNKMTDVLSDLIQMGGNNALIVSGVDFSHIGFKFGHHMTAEALLPQAQSYDRTIISHLLQGQPDKIFESAVETRDRFNVCGLPSIITFSRILQGSTGKLIAHETYNESATQSAVTYASMIFTGQ
ncbi:MAG: AmmeMemoRadiSam system protein B [Deltaproteobacteria bacterium]|nr:AmmeMemoRadiSam system protein B [Deltaproteobacteria bacterium]